MLDDDDAYDYYRDEVAGYFDDVEDDYDPEAEHELVELELLWRQ